MAERIRKCLVNEFREQLMAGTPNKDEIGLCKDKIDRALWRYHGLSTDALDFIINYDIKYQLDVFAGEDGDE